MKIIPFKTNPSIDSSVFIAENSLIIGDVTIENALPLVYCDNHNIRRSSLFISSKILNL